MRVLVLAPFAGSALALSDLQRARTKVPRDEYRSDFKQSTGAVLNSHLSNSHDRVKACGHWTVSELQTFQQMIHSHRDHALDAMYKEVNDNRAMRHDNIDQATMHWSDMNSVASGHKTVTEMQRDGHCHEAVMWWVHHLTEEKKKELGHVTIPTVPLVEWREPIPEEGEEAMKVYRAHYHPSSTCMACHGGGIPWQNPDVEPAPYPRQVNGNDRMRRCEEWYGISEGGTCGPCDGMAGAYYGDLPDEGIYPDCEVIAYPAEVPTELRAPTAWPAKFSVEMRGSDRWPRASASSDPKCNYTSDCSYYNASYEGQPIPPIVDAHWYSSIHGVLYVDHNPGQFGGGRLRHETVYEFPSGRDGAARSLTGRYGDWNSHLTEIHVQTPEMASANPANPGVMLNLHHNSMTDLNKSGVDDSKLDWRRIPSTDGTCVCVPDPAGLPYFEGAYSNATYKGRVKFIPPWQETAVGGPPKGIPVIADHFVKWTFHLFVNIENKLPVMFSSPFGGCATYGNWTYDPAELWPEWTVNPEPNRCFAPSGEPTCAPYIKHKTATTTGGPALV